MAGGAPRVPDAAQSERIVARVRRHARVLILPVILAAAIAAAVGYLGFGALTDPLQLALFWGGVGLIALLGVLLPVLAWLARRTTITDRRIVIRSGVFVRVRRELLLSRGYDLAVRRSWLQLAFGSGDVRINTGHERPVVLKDVPGPGLVQAALLELIRRERSLVADQRRVAQSAVPETIVWGSR